MNTTHWRRDPLAAACCAALAVTTAGATSAAAGIATVAWGSGCAPIVIPDDGAVRGMTAGTVDEFLGIPYAAPPTGRPAAAPPAAPGPVWGIRDTTQFAPSARSRRAPSQRPSRAFSEDCLYLTSRRPGRPSVATEPIGWRAVVTEVACGCRGRIDGGGLTEEGSSNYDGSELAAACAVVVTINYRLGALGFLAHPGAGLAAGWPGLELRFDGPAGGAALGARQHPPVRRLLDNVTIAGQLGRWSVGARPANLSRRARFLSAG